MILWSLVSCPHRDSKSLLIDFSPSHCSRAQSFILSQILACEEVAPSRGAGCQYICVHMLGNEHDLEKEWTSSS